MVGVRVEIMRSPNYEFISQFYFLNSINLYDNDDNSTVIYTTTNQMMDSFTNLWQFVDGFLVLTAIFWVTQS